MLKSLFPKNKSKTTTFILSVWITLISISVLVLYISNNSLTQSRKNIAQQGSAYAHLISEHNSFAFTVGDIILQDMFDYLEWSDFNGVMSSPRRSQILRYLLAHKERFPGIASFTIVGADGIRRIGIIGKDYTDLTDRGYYKSCIEGKKKYLSPVENGRASGMHGIHIARCLFSKDGEFGGLILINLSVDKVFLPFYQSLNLDKSVVTILADNQQIIIQYPAAISPTGQNLALFDFSKLDNTKDSGSYNFIDTVDGIEKTTSYERVRGTNIYSIVVTNLDEKKSPALLSLYFSIIISITMLLCALGITWMIFKGRELESAYISIEKVGNERSMLLTKMNTVVEDERRAIASEIHDTLNALAISIRSYAQCIIETVSIKNKEFSKADVFIRANVIVDSANELYRLCRNIVERLRPELLDVLGLGKSIDDMLNRINAVNPKCEFRFNVIGNISLLHESVSIALYRVIQEATSNILKYAAASAVNISLHLDGNTKILTLKISDDGVGFDTEKQNHGFGLISMRERIESIDGKFLINSSLESGTEIIITIKSPKLLAIT